MENQMECCATCEYCLAYPRGNRFGDVDYLCVITGYFVHSIHKDIRTVRHFRRVVENWSVSIAQYRKKS